MMSLRRIAGCCFTFLLLASSAFAASPRLNIINPRGIQRGMEHELVFSGSGLADAKDVMFYDVGFEILSVTGDGNTAKVKVKVASDCRLGEHVAQVRTASGITDYRTLYVEDLAVVEEKEPNSEFTAPQALTLNCVVNGSISSEDVDYFVIEAKQGQRISAEIVAMRLSSAMFDPYVAILDEKRFELDTNDDTALALQDGFVSVLAPADGKYYIEVRESAYSNGNTYRLHVGTFPRPKIAFPAGGKLGETLDVRFLGLPSGELKQSFTLPAQVVTDFGLFAKDDLGISPTPNIFRLFEHGNSFEAEPNNDLAQATKVELPLAMNGIIESDGDIDCFTFTAKKGAVYEVECFARRIRSELDPVMNIYKADGGGIAGNDDSRGPDSYIRFTVPEDGEYKIRITDHLGRGGPEFVYRVEFQSVVPSLTLGIPRNERYGQFRQQVFVPKGNRFGVLINANRANFGGEIALLGENLPAGITMHCDPMPANQNVMPVVFEATADAELSGKLVDFLAKCTDPKLNVQGRFVNRADYLVAEPGQSLYRWKDVDRLPIAVIEEVPFHLEIVEPKAPLVQEGAIRLKVVATKKEGWDEEISVQMPYRSPGVSAPPSVTIPKGQTEVLYELNAAGNAQVGTWKVFALGTSQGMWASSKLTKLDVAVAPVKFELQRTACEQGQEALVLCKVNHVTPFEGDAKAELVGIPPKVTVEAINFNKETQEVTFKLKTEKDSPVGKHGLYCQLTIPHQGETIACRGGSVEFQIDQPLPPAAGAPPTPTPAPAAAPAAEAAPAAAPPPPPKPLTRLEKLRLAAQERMKAEAGK